MVNFFSITSWLLGGTSLRDHVDIEDEKMFKQWLQRSLLVLELLQKYLVLLGK